jgi:hypothetical protein
MSHKNGDSIFFKKKTKIGDMIMNNNIAPNNVLVGDAWINLLIKIVKRIYSTPNKS